LRGTDENRPRKGFEAFLRTTAHRWAVRRGGRISGRGFERRRNGTFGREAAELDRPPESRPAITGRFASEAAPLAMGGPWSMFVPQGLGRAASPYPPDTPKPPDQKPKTEAITANAPSTSARGFLFGWVANIQFAAPRNAPVIPRYLRAGVMPVPNSFDQNSLGESGKVCNLDVSPLLRAPGLPLD
jgi:hypothetical protein